MRPGIERRAPDRALLGQPPMPLSRALAMLAGGWTGSRAVRRLDPALVLAQAWAPYRLARCRERLAAGEQAPPISVVGYRLPGRRVLYGVSDGQHRAVAHREAGVKVLARIGGYHAVEPARHVLWRGHLWRREGDGLRAVWDVPVATCNHPRVGSHSSGPRAHAHCNSAECPDPQSSPPGA